MVLHAFDLHLVRHAMISIIPPTQHQGPWRATLIVFLHYRKLIWDTKVPRHHASNTYVLLTIMHTQEYTYPRYVYLTYTYSKYAYPRYIYPGYTYSIYTYLDYVYIRIFYILKVYMPKNTIPRVYIPHLCLLGMYKSYIPRSMYKISHILYVLSMVPRHLGALVIKNLCIYIYIGK
jgi:hypothetical protein